MLIRVHQYLKKTMKRNKSENNKGSFIEQQISDLNKEIKNSQEKLVENAVNVANNIDNEMVSDLSMNSNYFNEALKKIDADRIALQMKLTKMNSESEMDEDAIGGDVEDINDKNTLNSNEVENRDNVNVDDDVKEGNEKKLSFLDKLLQII